MRITFVHKTANYSGGNRVVAGYAERLRDRGHEVTVVTGQDPRPRPLRKLINRYRGRHFPVGDGRSWLDEIDVPHVRLDHSGPVRATDLPDADVIVATWWETAEWIAALPPEKGAHAYFVQGIEWTIDDMPVERVRQTWRLPMHKIVIADFMARIAAKEFDDEDVSLVPNAVDFELFHASPRDRGHPPTVGLMQVGPLAIKGGDVTHAALLEAKRRLPELRGRTFGRSLPPPERPLPSWVEMQISPTPEALRQLYASCDVFIHGARAEGFGLPILEAMACRTPVVATPAGAAPDLLPDGGGILVPHEDPAAMAEAIVELCSISPEAWRERSECAHARATRHSWEDATTAMERALRRACEKSPSPGAARGRVSSGVTLSMNPVQAFEHRVGTLEASNEAALSRGLSRLEATSEPSWHRCPSDSALWRLDAGHYPSELIDIVGAFEESVHDAAHHLRESAHFLTDPLRREDGVFRLVGRSAITTGTIYHLDPPLRSRFTALLPLDTGALELFRGDGGAKDVMELRPGVGVVMASGLNRPFALVAQGPKSTMRFVALHLHEPILFPSEVPPVRTRRFHRELPPPLRWVPQRASEGRLWTTHLLETARERFLGIE